MKTKDDEEGGMIDKEEDVYAVMLRLRLRITWSMIVRLSSRSIMSLGAACCPCMMMPKRSCEAAELRMTMRRGSTGHDAATGY